MRILDEQLSKFSEKFLFFDVGGKSLTKYRNFAVFEFRENKKFGVYENTRAIVRTLEILFEG